MYEGLMSITLAKYGADTLQRYVNILYRIKEPRKYLYDLIAIIPNAAVKAARVYVLQRSIWRQYWSRF